VQAECRRRTFWSAYSLDNYLSTALGRPRTFHDDDIDQQLPSAIDDNMLVSGLQSEVSFGLRGQSVMLGVVAYAQYVPLGCLRTKASGADNLPDSPRSSAVFSETCTP
jgi:transcription factor-like protein